MNNKYKLLLENSLWIVPPSTELAFQYENGDVWPVKNQTLWIINSYDSGYFFGDSFTCLTGNDFTQYMKKGFIGTITPAGAVYITFMSSDSKNVLGIGTLEKYGSEYRFVMQMQSGTNTSGLCHVSFMISITKESFYYQNLPAVGVSVPEFLSQFIPK